MSTMPTTTLNLMFFFTKDADTLKVPPLLKVAKKVFGDYGFQLSIWPGETPSRHTIFEDWNKTIGAFGPQGLLLRNAIARQYPTHVQRRLPVFFCWMSSDAVQGVTLPSPPDPRIPLYVLVDTRKPLTRSCSTLAHEIGHAAGLDHNNTSTTNLMYEHGNYRNGTLLSEDELKKIRGAYFRQT